jgi:hypothetical protein
MLMLVCDVVNIERGGEERDIGSMGLSLIVNSGDALATH